MAKNTIRLVDIAAEAGVSRVAVGKVLLGSGNDRIKVAPDTADRIRKIADDLGYRPNRAAQQLGGKASHLIGVVTYFHAPSIELFRLAALERKAYERGYQIIVRILGDPGSQDEMLECLDALESQGVDGVIFLTGEACACTDKARQRFNVALYSGCNDVLRNLPGIIIDLETGIRLSVDHLFSIGRKRIGLVNVAGSRYGDVRRQVIGELVKNVPDAAMIEWTHSGAYQKLRKLPPMDADTVVRELVLEQRVDGLIALNDYWGAALIKALHRVGVDVPGDVAVVGYSNLELSEFTEPGLTTIDENNEAYATAYLDLFSEGMKGVTSLRSVMTPSLIVRGSTRDLTEGGAA